MVLTLATPTEIRTIITLRNMVSNMIVPAHDEYDGHKKSSCRVCVAMKESNKMLAEYEHFGVLLPNL